MKNNDLLRSSGLLGIGRFFLVIAIAFFVGCGQSPAPAQPAAAPPASVPAAMAETAPAQSDLSRSDMAAEFELLDTLGKAHKLSDYKDSHVVLEWVNYGCPFVKKFYGVGAMQKLQKTYVAKGVVWLSICSSAPGKQGNMTPAEWNKAIKANGAASTAVLLDSDGKVGGMYGARTTPHMFVIAPGGKFIYRGGIDDKPTPASEDIAGAHNHVAAALDEALAGKSVTVASSEPYGCSVKYATP